MNRFETTVCEPDDMDYFFKKNSISQCEKKCLAFRCSLQDSLQFYFFPEIDKRRLSSTNGLERTNREIRRRSRVVGVFPSVESYLRLITSYLIEYSEDWANEYAYIRADKLWQLLESEQAQAAS